MGNIERFKSGFVAGATSASKQQHHQCVNSAQGSFHHHNISSNTSRAHMLNGSFSPREG